MRSFKYDYVMKKNKIIEQTFFSDNIMITQMITNDEHVIINMKVITLKHEKNK